MLLILNAEKLKALSASCRRAAAKGPAVRSLAHDLTAEDFALVANILSNLAAADDDQDARDHPVAVLRPAS